MYAYMYGWCVHIHTGVNLSKTLRVGQRLAITDEVKGLKGVSQLLGGHALAPPSLRLGICNRQICFVPIRDPCMYECMYIYIYTCMYNYVFMYVCMYVCMYV